MVNNQEVQQPSTDNPTAASHIETTQHPPNEPIKTAGGKVAPQEQRRVFIPMRAQFKVTEITHTTRGVTVLTLAASFDGSIPKDNRLAVGNSPKGDLSIDVDPKWADANVSHGSTFTLVNGPAPGPAI